MKQSEKKARYVCVVDVAGRAGVGGECVDFKRLKKR